jgi:Sulfotransferase family
VVVAQETCPIILYGAPRSGTTFLNRILNEHPDIFISNETRIFQWAHASLNQLPHDPANLFVNRDEFICHLKSQYPSLIRDFYRRLYPQARYWGDKAPHYVFRQTHGCLETIADLFPETRFIQIVRDGRDVVASLLRKRMPDGEQWTTFEGAHRIWTNALEIGCGFGRAQPPLRYFELRYEDLIRDEVGMARKLFDFLGIEIHSNVVDFCQL